MKHDLKTILQPFHLDNLQDSLLIPGTLLWIPSVLMVTVAIISGLLLFEGGVQPFYGALGLLLMLTVLPALLLATGFFGILLVGYLWRMVGHLQTEQSPCALPSWSGYHWQAHFMTGLHGMGYALAVCFILVLSQQVFMDVSGVTAQAQMIDTPIAADFQMISYADPPPAAELPVDLFLLGPLCLSLLSPFLLAPLFYTAQKPGLSPLLSSLVPAWRWTFSRYWPVFGVSFLAVFVLGTVFLLLTLLFSLTFIGIVFIPFLFAGLLMLVTSLYVQAFSTPPEPLPVSILEYEL